MSPFDSINSICNKTPVEGMDLYNQFLTNRYFSYFRETILIANLGNQFQGMDNDLHFNFYNSIISKGKRFTKWAKSNGNDEELKVIAEYYDISYKKTKDIIKILSEKQKNEILKYMKEKNNV